MKKIIIMSHNPQRDRQCDDLLAYELKRRGHLVWVRDFLANDRFAICAIKPDIVILPEIRCAYTVDLARLLRSWGVKVVVRFCEMGITDKSIPFITDEYRNAIYGNWNVSDCVDLALAWGPEMKSMLEKYSTVPVDKTVVVGAMAFDQYFKEFKGLPAKEKPVLLFATGFPYADRNEEHALPEAKSGDKLHKEFVKKCQKYRSLWLKDMAKIMDCCKDKFAFAVKCHPGERETSYRHILKDYPVTYISGWNALVALHYADVLIHSGSTMAYEAHLLNKPAFVMHPMTSDVILAGISPNIDNFDYATVPAGSNAHKEELDYLEQNCFSPNDGSSYMRAADEIEKLEVDRDAIRVPEVWPQESEAKYLSEGVWVDIQQWTCNACGRQFFTRSYREMAPCPWCGVSSVKIQRPINPQGDNDAEPKVKCVSDSSGSTGQQKTS